MSQPVTRWKHANNKTVLSIFGYLRRVSKRLDGLEAVFNLCVSYYFEHELFTNHGNNIVVNKKGNIAKGKWIQFKSRRPPKNTVYGNRIIDLSSKSRKEYKWTFNVLQVDPNIPAFWIGIDIPSTRKLNYASGAPGRDACFFTNQATLWNERNKHDYDEDIKWGKHNQIEMILTLNVERRIKLPHLSCVHWRDHVLCLNINGEEVAQIIIDPNRYEKYMDNCTGHRLAVIISDEGQQIELINV